MIPGGLRPCLACLPRDRVLGPVATPVVGPSDTLVQCLPALNDAEGARLPSALPPVVDAHVHLFPDRLFEAVWTWFGEHGWPVRYRLHADAVVGFLRARGVDRIVALQYAHKPGMARALNAWMAELMTRHPGVVGLATVHPDDVDPASILRDAFAAGLRGVKLHCHVQAFAPDEQRMEPIWQACSDAGLPVVVHAGREPRSPHYPVDTWAVCAVERTAAVLRSFPRLKLVVPHLGADEFAGYAELLDRHDNLWLDTTMMLADYFTVPDPPRWLRRRPDRILFGTDFPNLPYAWDREIRHLVRWKLPEPELAAIVGANAEHLYGLDA